MDGNASVLKGIRDEDTGSAPGEDQSWLANER